MWFLPVPTINWFDGFEIGLIDVWVHELYLYSIPDTFAFLTTHATDESYFSLKMLVRPGVAFMGGIFFNNSIVKGRLKEQGIHVKPEDWCKTLALGWSERIIKNNWCVTNLNVCWLSTDATILQPLNEALCQPFHPKFQFPWEKHTGSFSPFL